MDEVHFEVFRCPNDLNHVDFRKNAWTEPWGTAYSNCPECGTPGISAKDRGQHYYRESNLSEPWMPYRVLYYTS